MNELRSNVSPRDEATQPFRVVLHRSNNGGWVTHCENVVEVEKVKVTSNISSCGRFSSKSIPDFYWGHYFEKDYEKALDNYKKRCDKYNL